MDSRICIAVFTAFLTCLVPNVFSEQVLDLSPNAVTGQIEFSIRLYQAIADSVRDNFAVSTIDVFLGLLRLFHGSEPPTKSMLDYILGISTTLSPTTAYSTLIRATERARCGKSNFREFMLYQDELQLKPSYEQAIRNIYNQSTTSLYFSKRHDVLHIIGYFHRSRSISTRYWPYEFEETMAVVLAGGGLWEEDMPLEKDSLKRCTYQGMFQVTESLTELDINYTYMHVVVTNGILEDIGATYVELNWGEKSSNVSTYIISPNKINNLHLVEKHITSETIKKMVKNKSRGTIRLSLPEINLDSKLTLKKVLRDHMKIDNVFGGETNFSGLADPPPKQVNEVVNTVTLRAFPFNDTVPQCLGNKEPPLNSRTFIPRFKMNHPTLIVRVHKGDPAIGMDPFVLGMARVKHPA